jgi:hypothetical protein
MHCRDVGSGSGFSIGLAPYGARGKFVRLMHGHDFKAKEKKSCVCFIDVLLNCCGCDKRLKLHDEDLSRENTFSPTYC